MIRYTYKVQFLPRSTSPRRRDWAVVSVRDKISVDSIYGRFATKERAEAKAAELNKQW